MLTRLDVLDVLMCLPGRWPVAWASLSARERRVVSRMPQDLVSVDRGQVVRHVVAPLQVDHVAVAARSFRAAIDAITTFSTYCPRTLVLPSAQTVDEAGLAEAAFFGVGVVVDHGGELVELVAAEPLTGALETPAGWAFSETLYGRLANVG
jgi:hypothetical protein